MDYNKVLDSYPDSLSQYDLETILNNSRHWDLNFSEIKDITILMVEGVYELEIINYRQSFPTGIVREIDSFRWNLIQYFNLIKDFSITQWNAPEIRNQYLNQLRTLYNSNYYRIEEIINNFKIKKLLQDNSWLNKQIDELDKIEKMTSELEEAKKALEIQGKELESMSEVFSKKIEEIKSVSDTWNELWNLESSTFFELQGVSHSIDKKSWLNKRNYFLRGLIIWTVILSVVYLVIRFNLKITLEIHDRIEIWLFALIWYSLLYFGLSFSTNNYYIERWLEIENQHRRNIANTAPKLQLWVSNDSDKAIIIGEEVRALFAPIWAKMEWKWTEITTPFLEIIKTLINK